MFRLLGFLVGSITSILIILMIIGMPKLHLADEDEDQRRYDAAIEMLKAKQSEIESVTGRLTEDIARVSETVDAGIEPAGEPETAVAGEAGTETADEAGRAGPATDRIEPEPAAGPETQWYSFWNPFRSEIAASGFVSQLERVTGIDYRIVKIRTGVYEVAFAYHDDAERRSKLSQISAATGLDLPDS